MKKDYQWGRAIFHFLSAITVIVLVQVCAVSTDVLDQIIMYLGGTVILLDIIRVGLYRYTAANPFQLFSLVWGGVIDWSERIHFVRKSEAKKLTAGTSYVAGVAMVYWLTVHIMILHLYIPYIAVIILASGDPAARIVGLYWGGPKIKGNRTWAGFFGFMVFSMIMLMVTNILMLWYPFYPSSDIEILGVQFFGCVVGAITESLAPRADNFFIPVLSGLAMALFYTQFM